MGFACEGVFMKLASFFILAGIMNFISVSHEVSAAGCSEMYRASYSKASNAAQGLGIATAPSVGLGGVLSFIVAPVGVPLLIAGAGAGTAALVSLKRMSNLDELSELMQDIEAAGAVAPTACGVLDCTKVQNFL